MAAPASTASKPGRPVVLLVDDESELLDVLGEGMKNEFTVETAASAEEADLLMASSGYDVLICDHMLPGEAGLEFLIRMSERHPGTRRIMLTGYMNPELISRSVAVARLSACLLKPVKAAALATAVRTALASV
jgi:two-component system, NtrC family, response regulator HupR/HoxA